MENQIVVLISTPTLEVGQQIALHLVEQRLAACVNVIAGIRSIYRWEDAVQQDQEVLLLCKTRRELLDPHLIAAVHALHPYELPEIIALPLVGGSSAYLDWITASTRSEPGSS